MVAANLAVNATVAAAAFPVRVTASAVQVSEAAWAQPLASF